MKTLFISKNLAELSALPDFCKSQSIHLVAHSFLNFNALEFKVNFPFDCVFFSSPRSVHFFLSAYSLPQTCLIAVAGQKTKSAVTGYGLNVNFEVQRAGNVLEGAKQFAAWIGSKRVLFPGSSISNKSYQKFLNSEKIEDVVVYETVIGTKEIQESSFYVFTSPSNVRGFLESNSIPKGAVVIAWGETTALELERFGIDDCKKMTNSSEEELVSILSV